jgi:Na+/melibiose symporter-like transporter
VKQALVIAVGGLALAGLVLFLARRRLITLRFAVGWLGIAGVAILAAVLAPLVNPLADVFQMTGTAVFLVAVTTVLIAICIQLSITVSGLWSRVRDLAESHALMEAELDALRTAPAEPPR